MQQARPPVHSTMTHEIVPHTAAALAGVLRDATNDRRPVTPWGAGLHQYLGYAAAPEALQLSTRALNRIIEYNPADLTLTTEAGITLDDVRRTLATHRQWLPWDPPAPGTATIGGLLASGAGGPLRLGYGSPRDWTLGMRVALGDGRLVKSGGRVVKNVAGYDLHKLHLGALGTLGVIVEVTFKLAPLPDSMTTITVECDDLAQACRLAAQLRERPLAPVSLAIVSEPANGNAARGSVLLAARFAGAAGGVARQISAALSIAALHNLNASTHTGDLDTSVWRRISTIGAPPDHDRTLLLRVGVPPSALHDAMNALQRHAPGDSVRIAGHAGVGLAHAWWQEIEAHAAMRALDGLRASLGNLGGYAVVERAPEALRAQLNLWGPSPAALPLMQALRQRWDPAGILNRGRFIV